jgi:hypothetical protein
VKRLASIPVMARPATSSDPLHRGEEGEEDKNSLNTVPSSSPSSPLFTIWLRSSIPVTARVRK